MSCLAEPKIFWSLVHFVESSSLQITEPKGVSNKPIHCRTLLKMKGRCEVSSYYNQFCLDTAEPGRSYTGWWLQPGSSSGLKILKTNKTYHLKHVSLLRQLILFCTFVGFKILFCSKFTTFNNIIGSKVVMI